MKKKKLNKKELLLYGKLCERAVCSKFCVLIGYPSGQDRAILPAGDCLFLSFLANKISPKFKQVRKSFLSPKIFSAKVKRFFVISLSSWNQKMGFLNSTLSRSFKTQKKDSQYPAILIWAWSITYIYTYHCVAQRLFTHL